MNKAKKEKREVEPKSEVRKFEPPSVRQSPDKEEKRDFAVAEQVTKRPTEFEHRAPSVEISNQVTVEGSVATGTASEENTLQSVSKKSKMGSN